MRNQNAGMGALVEKLVSPRVLNQAWRSLCNDGGFWCKGVLVNEMRRDVVLHIGQMAEELASGRYQPDAVHCFRVPKGDGKTRTVCAYSVRDRVAQRAFLSVLEPLGEAQFLNCSYGYRPRCSVDMAVARVREWVRDGWCWLMDGDIEACFDRIPQDKILANVHSLCKDREWVRLVQRWLENMPMEHIAYKRGVGLPRKNSISKSRRGAASRVF